MNDDLPELGTSTAWRDTDTDAHSPLQRDEDQDHG